MTRFNKDLGDRGELLAIKYLRKSGYKIIERNFRVRNGEIDIVAVEYSSDPTLVFIEVKTRQSKSFGTPLESIGYYKIQAMNRTAQFYAATHRNLPGLLRLDGISVEISEKGETISHLKNIG